jgi:NADH:ubiquinone oxidoreductase subunit E
MGTELEIILKKYKQGKREDLIPLLQEIQEDHGFLSEDAIVKVGSFLGLSTTKIYGLATFYGSLTIINKIKEETGVNAGQTTRDGNFSYEIVSCMGGCHNGPLLNVNGQYHTHVKAEQLPELIKKLRYVIEND